MANFTPTSAPIPPRTEIGDYRVQDHFASGGMGDLYRVINPLLRETFAMKVLREDPAAADRRESIQRFFEEARTTIRLRHGNIVTLHTMGLEPTAGRLYFIMDYVGVSPQRYDELLHGTGPWFAAVTTSSSDDAAERVSLSLEDVLREHGPIPEDILRILAGDIASALNHAHQSGVVHCDLKPANILLRNDGHAVVGDFGIARAYRTAGEADGSSGGSILGTPQYMAPEQRDPAAPLTPAADIYAYGVMIYRLLTGSFPEGVWKRPSELGFNPGWDRLCADCLVRDPAGRWASMRQIHAWLRAMPGLQQSQANERLVQARSSRLRILLTLGVPACLLVIAAGLLCWQMNARKASAGRVRRWVPAVPTPAAFEAGNTARAIPLPSAVGMLTYGDDAPATLPLPPNPLAHVNRLALPSQVSALPEGFVERFPRLEYVVCDPNNAVFFARDGILYRHDDPSRPCLVPPRLFGDIRLPPTVTSFPHPWRGATTTANTLRTETGAYGQPLTLRARRAIEWVCTAQ